MFSKKDPVIDDLDSAMNAVLLFATSPKHFEYVRHVHGALAAIKSEMAMGASWSDACTAILDQPSLEPAEAPSPVFKPTTSEMDSGMGVLDALVEQHAPHTLEAGAAPPLVTRITVLNSLLLLTRHGGDVVVPFEKGLQMLIEKGTA